MTVILNDHWHPNANVKYLPVNISGEYIGIIDPKVLKNTPKYKYTAIII